MLSFLYVVNIRYCSGIELIGWATGLVKSQKYMGKKPITKDHQLNQPLNLST